jgi:NitT/TauT family transport system ATP-binding protein
MGKVDSTMKTVSDPQAIRDAQTEIVVDSLSVRFRTGSTEIVALDNINLTVKKDEFVCIMGPSGCGKTTILNALAGFIHPSDGLIQVDGRPVTKPGPDRAVVFQSDAVFPWMTVEDNIAYSQRMRGTPPAEVKRIVDRYVELVHLEEFRKAWPKQLSGGMKKRVDLARAYAANPEVLLLDEPFGALDIMTKEYLQEELHKLWLAAPRTIIFITHDVEEALFLGDRVVVMTPRPGRIAQIFTPKLPRTRDMLIKTDETFVDLRRQVLATFTQAMREPR